MADLQGVFGNSKEFWELDSGFYFEGHCPAVEERVIDSIKTYLTSGSWSTIERQTLLPPAYIDESYGALETSNPCMDSLSEIENRGNLTWEEIEELRLWKDNVAVGAKGLCVTGVVEKTGIVVGTDVVADDMVVGARIFGAATVTKETSV